MAGNIEILTPNQVAFLAKVSQESSLVKKFYFTGGTPLAAFYLQHRMSEDIDLFSEEEEVNVGPIRAFIKKIEKPLGIKAVEYRQYIGLHTFELKYNTGDILKVDFNYYPFPCIERGMKYLNIYVDSLLDIATNKVHTIYMKPRARDFIDVFFIIREKGYNFKDLIAQAKIKFDWHIDAVEFGKRLLSAANATDFPRMLKPIDHAEWQDFFIEEAKKLKDGVLE